MNLTAWAYYLSAQGFYYVRDNHIMALYCGAPSAQLITLRSPDAMHQIRNAAIALRPELEAEISDIYRTIEYIDSGLDQSCSFVETKEDRDDFAGEQINKAYRRGIISAEANFALLHHYGIDS